MLISVTGDVSCSLLPHLLKQWRGEQDWQH